MENSQRREKGQGLVEYALILVLVAIVVIAILLLLGPTTGNVFSTVVAFFAPANGGAGGSNQIAWQAGPQVTKTSGLNCTYAASTISFRVTQGGSPVSGVSLSGTVVVHDNDSHEITRFNISGTSGSDGVASLSGSSSGTSACGGQQATVYVSGVSSRTDTDLDH
jgi:pilus assembly protein Flp/PilA